MHRTPVRLASGTSRPLDKLPDLPTKTRPHPVKRNRRSDLHYDQYLLPPFMKRVAFQLFGGLSVPLNVISLYRVSSVVGYLGLASRLVVLHMLLHWLA